MALVTLVRGRWGAVLATERVSNDLKRMQEKKPRAVASLLAACQCLADHGPAMRNREKFRSEKPHGFDAIKAPGVRMYGRFFPGRRFIVVDVTEKKRQRMTRQTVERVTRRLAELTQALGTVKG